MAHQDNANLKIIISRIQQRRGLKQDLPHPLRPGEIGFATDSKQVYIGADTDDAISSTYNKTVTLEGTLGASARTLSLANTQIIKFTVPHIRYPKGANIAGFKDGVSKSKAWKANTVLGSNISTNSNDNPLINTAGNVVTRTVFDTTVANSANSVVNQNQTSRTFTADDITVLLNGVKQDGDSSGTGALVNTAYDYNFVSGNASTSDHSLYLGFAPQQSDDVAITYYGNSHVNHTLSNTVIANGATTTGFYADQSIPSYRHLDSDLVVVNPQVGTGFIGLEQKHIDVVTEGLGIANTSSISAANVVLVKDPSDPSLLSNLVYSGIGQVTAGAPVAGVVTFDTGKENIIFTELANASTGANGYVWTEGASHNVGTIEAPVEAPSLTTWYHKKLLPISANSVANIFSVTLPSNAWSTGRTVTAAVEGASNTVTLTANISGVKANDLVVFTGDAVLEAGSPYTVSSPASGAFTIEEAGLTVGVTSGLDFINKGQLGGNKIQVFSPEHGFNIANISTDINITGSDTTAQIADATFSLADTANLTNNTFYRFYYLSNR